DLAVGDLAPDFELKDQNNQVVRLTSFRGEKAVLLVFYPLAFSRVCSGELAALRDDLASFHNDRVELLTVSVDSVYAHKVWAVQEAFDFPLLADFWPHGEVARRYGVFDSSRGYALRGTFLVDRDGVVRYRVVNEAAVARDVSEYREALTVLG
ncbi:MAG: mycoredoxin-dependent peroxiredoxin, partial [Cryptosporangiaceae bacterium]|nr:mycoredoxin-dependent peroxiredoxin [Cryptosporangiaceae bacterium]